MGFKQYVWFAAVTVLAFVLRVWDLGSPSRMVMDEIYYTVEANSMLQRGYESYVASDWSVFSNVDRLNEKFEKFTTYLQGGEGFLSWHPPLGKWLIASGMGVFGVDNPVGWRIMSVVFGTGVVVLTMWLAFLIFRKQWVALLAGVFVAVDGFAIAMSRIAMLDVFMVFFGVAGFVFIVKYVYARVLDGRGFIWLVLASVMFGLSAGVKWSGLFLYFAAGLIVITCEVWLFVKMRRVTKTVLVGQVAVKVLTSVGVFVLTYVTVWIPYVLGQIIRKGFSEGATSLVDVHLFMFGNGQSIDANHNFRSKASEWLLVSHPTLVFTDGQGSLITTLPNLVFWFTGLLGFAVLFVMLLKKRVFLSAWVLFPPVVFSLLPWLVLSERTTYQYYAIVFLPFLYITAAWLLMRLWSRKADRLGKIFAMFIVTVGLLFSVVMLPSATGMRNVEGFPVGSVFFNYWTNLNASLGLYDVTQVENKELVE